MRALVILLTAVAALADQHVYRSNSTAPNNNTGLQSRPNATASHNSSSSHNSTSGRNSTSGNGSLHSGGHANLTSSSTEGNGGHDKEKETIVWTRRHRSAPYLMLASACEAAAQNYTFMPRKKMASRERSRGPTITCKNIPYAGTLALCLNNMAVDRKQLLKAFEGLRSCPKVTFDEFELIYANASNHSIYEHEVPKKVILNKPVRISPDTYAKVLAETVIRPQAMDLDTTLGLGILYYWFGIMILSIITHFVCSTGLVKKFRDPVTKKLQSIFFMAGFSRGHQQHSYFMGAIQSYLPTRKETVIITGYLILLAVFMSVGYHSSELGVRLVADRTGILAISHLPLIFLFPGRNNFLSKITGFNFEAFIHFHKWTARMMVMNAAIHGITFAVVRYRAGRGQLSLHLPYYIFGITAACCGAALVLHSYHWVRKHFYEVFLVTHIILAAVFIASAFHHCFEFGYMEFVVVAIGVWAIDRILRIARLVRFGVSTAKISVVGPELLKINIPKRPGSHWNGKPGQFAYISFLRGSGFWQSHPFTIADNGKEIVLYVKAKNGITRKLFNSIADAVNQTDTVKVLVEGPYGHSAPNYMYDNINLVAGGNGIPGIFDHAVKLNSKYSQGQRNIRMIWISQNLNQIAYFLPELKRLKGTTVDVTIYLTREKELPFNSESSDDTQNEKISEKNSEKVQTLVVRNSAFLASHLQDFKVVCGRPNMKSIVCDWFTNDQGHSSVTVCGPGILCDSLREAVSLYVEDHKGRVDYFEELQVW